VSEFLTYAEVAQLLRKDLDAAKRFPSRHHVPRCARQEDVRLALAALAQGRRSDL
jgi:hypothetical protein